jgi:hypothetical protein
MYLVHEQIVYRRIPVRLVRIVSSISRVTYRKHRFLSRTSVPCLVPNSSCSASMYAAIREIDIETPLGITPTRNGTQIWEAFRSIVRRPPIMQLSFCRAKYNKRMSARAFPIPSPKPQLQLLCNRRELGVFVPSDSNLNKSQTDGSSFCNSADVVSSHGTENERLRLSEPIYSFLTLCRFSG